MEKLEKNNVIFRKRRRSTMNIGRAQQIIESTKDFLVTYNSIPVWIQNVDPEAETARVYTAASPEDEMVVPVSKLEEQ